ncbi:MAG: PAS domain-containing protein [Bacteroidales bacterium]|nr:PAS domain-containing protein [Bacteroidales bacterium]
MRLRYFFIILAVLQLSVWVIVLLLGINEQSVWFYVVELLTVANIAFLVYFYRKVLKPIDSITAGFDLLKEQDFNSSLAKRGHYEADRIVDLFNTMLAQLRNERLKNQEQNHLLNMLIECSPMGVVMMNSDDKIILANTASLKMLETDEAIGVRLDNLRSPLAQDLLKLKQGDSATVRTRNSMIYRCSKHSFVDSGVPHPFYLIESLTDEMMKAERNAYEKVIRIMAHEVNNTVAGLSSALDTVDSVLEQMGNAEDVREMMQVCVERGVKMSAFITNLSNVVKIPEAVLKEVQLNDIIERMSILFQSYCSENGINLHLDCCDEDTRVEIDELLFEQVLQNIVKNAVESIVTDGDIYITTSTYNGKVRLVIADTGKGISKEVEQNLFSPFFTTKPLGQGVGLMFVREILMRHRCTFSLFTGDDGITRFTIDFN